jgi:hypothetical protein
VGNREGTQMTRIEGRMRREGSGVGGETKLGMVLIRDLGIWKAGILLGGVG